jgi:protein SCO1/2
MKGTWRWVFLGMIIGLALSVAGYRWFTPPYAYKGSPMNPPFQAPEIALHDQNGQPFRLSALKGHIVLVYFGFTNCPDICPATLATIKAAREKLGSRASDVAVVFITVDPANDTPARLKTYLAGFDPAFTGLDGTQSDLEAVWKAYGVYKQAKAVSTGGDELLDHSALIYLIDPQGNLRMTYGVGVSSADLATDLSHLLDSTPKL